MNPAKKAKALQDRQEWRQKSLSRIESIRPGDLTRMFGLLAQTLGESRRMAELDVLRSERFHSDNPEMVERFKEQVEDYDRRLEIASGVLKMLVAFQGEDALKDLLTVWCKNLPTWREDER